MINLNDAERIIREWVDTQSLLSVTIEQAEPHNNVPCLYVDFEYVREPESSYYFLLTENALMACAETDEDTDHDENGFAILIDAIDDFMFERFNATTMNARFRTLMNGDDIEETRP
jgi:hypothetical protein